MITNRPSTYLKHAIAEAEKEYAEVKLPEAKSLEELERELCSK
jgi:hypothetical protein